MTQPPADGVHPRELHITEGATNNFPPTAKAYCDSFFPTTHTEGPFSFIDTITTTSFSPTALHLLTWFISRCSDLSRVELAVGSELNPNAIQHLVDGLASMHGPKTLTFSDVHNTSNPQTAAQLGRRMCVNILVGGFKKITHLTIPEGAYIKLLHPGATLCLDSLTQLTVTPQDRGTITGPPGTLRAPLLRNLNLPADTPLEAIEILPCMPKVSTLSLTIRRLGFVGELQEFAKELATVCPKVDRLRITMITNASDDVQLTYLQPLAKLECISSFELVVSSVVRYGSEDLKNLLANWDHISNLVLNPSPAFIIPMDPVPLPPVECLNVVATCGPKLNSFGAFLDCSGPFNAPSRFWGDRLRLNLGSSPGPTDPDDLDDLADLLKELFPGSPLPRGNAEWITDLQDRMTETLE